MILRGNKTLQRVEPQLTESEYYDTTLETTRTESQEISSKRNWIFARGSRSNQPTNSEISSDNTKTWTSLSVNKSSRWLKTKNKRRSSVSGCIRDSSAFRDFLQSSTATVDRLNESSHHSAGCLSSSSLCVKTTRYNGLEDEASFIEADNVDFVRRKIIELKVERKELEDQLCINLDLAKDRITGNNREDSELANKIVAVLAMKRVDDMKSKLSILKTQIKMLRQLESSICTSDHVSLTIVIDEIRRIMNTDAPELPSSLQRIVSTKQFVDSKSTYNKEIFIRKSDDQVLQDLKRTLLKDALTK